MVFRKRGLLTILLALAWASFAFAGQTFTVLFFNDFHAHLEPFEVSGVDGEVGGLARLAGLADGVRAANDAAGVPTFLLIAGDVLQGTPYSTVYRGEAEVACLNEMEVTAMCLGNHEFDYGQDNLKRLIGLANFPVLSANITLAETEEYKTFTDEVAWLDAGDKRILVIGLTTWDTPITTAPPNVAGLKFAEPTATAERVIGQYGDEADVIIALTHIGFENDAALADAVPALDLVVGGHSHTKVDRLELVGDTPVCSAYEYGEYLGRIDLDVNDDGDVKVAGYELIPVTARAPADEDVTAVIESYKRGLSAKLAEVVGETDVILSYKSAREAETNFGDYIADLIRDATGADVALVNGGALRADLGPGEITTGDVLTALPFGNEVVVLDVPGVALRQALELCAREKVGEGGFLQVSGCGYTVRPGEGVDSVIVAGKPLNDEATYRLALPDFLAMGGDGYTMFVTDAPPYKTGILLYDLVISGLREGRPLPAAPAGRIKIITE